MASSTSRTIRANIFFAEKDLALREDVHKLGELVGELVREQGGEALYDLVEAARRASIAHREGDSDAYAELKALLGALAPTTAREFIRAFSTYFQMVNMAEKVHRIRRRRAYLRDENTPQPFGFIDILRRLKAEGASADEVERVIDTICIEPVFTAHPTEVTRRTLLRKQQSIARHLVEMMDPYMTPQELEATLGQIRMEMTTGWQTSEYPMEGIRLRDEAEHVLFFLTDVLYRMIPPFYESLEGALTADVPRIWRAHTRTVGAAVLLVGRRRHGRQSERHREGHPRDARPAALARVGPVLPGMPGARAPPFSGLEPHRRFRGARAAIAAVRGTLPRGRELGAGAASTDAVSLLLTARRRAPSGNVRRRGVSLRVPDGVHRRYRAHRSEPARAQGHGMRDCSSVQRLLRRAQTFGFYVATLDIRQNALVHRRVIGEALQERALARARQHRAHAANRRGPGAARVAGRRVVV